MKKEIYSRYLAQSLFDRVFDVVNNEPLEGPVIDLSESLGWEVDD